MTLENSGKSIVVAGDSLPKAAHAIVFAINEALQAPIKYVEVAEAEAGIRQPIVKRGKG